VAVVKAVHTAVFLVELMSIGWLVVTGLTGRRDRSVAVAAGAVAIEAPSSWGTIGYAPS
jgi:hypothetical protein